MSLSPRSVRRNASHASILLLALSLPAAAGDSAWPSLELRDDHAGPVASVAFTSDGQFFASADTSGKVIVRMFPGPKLFATLQGAGFTGLAWAADGRTLVAGGLDHLAYIWRRPFSEPPRTMPCSGPVGAVAVTRDGVVLAAVGATIRRWLLPKMEELTPFKGHTDDVHAVRVSPGGLVVSGGRDHTIRVWDAAARTSRILRGHEEGINDLAFSSDGALLAAAYHDGTIGLWNANTWRLERLLRGPSGPVRGVSLSPDGRFVAGAGSDSTVWIWALRDTGSILRLAGHRGRVNGVAFSPNSRWLLSAASDTAVRVWTVP